MSSQSSNSVSTKRSLTVFEEDSGFSLSATPSLQKRVRLEKEAPVPELPSFHVSYVTQNDLAERNVVWMNQTDYEELFSGEEGSCYLQIANRIFQAAIGQMVGRTSIGINELQYQETRQAYFQMHGGRCVVAKPVREVDCESIPSYENVTFFLKRKELSFVGGGSLVVSLQELRARFAQLFTGHYISHDQNLSVSFPWGEVKAQLVDCDQKSAQQSFLGRIEKGTKIDFHFDPKEEITVVKKVLSSEVEKFCFHLSTQRRLPSAVMSDFPLKVNDLLLIKKIKEQVGDQRIFPGHTITVPHSLGWDIAVKFEKGVIPAYLEPKKNEGLKAEEFYETAYMLNDNPKFYFHVDMDKVMLTRGKSKVSKEMEFTVINLLGNQPGSSVETSNERWLDLEEFQQALRSLQKNYHVGEKFVVGTSSGRFEVRVSQIAKNNGMLVSNKDLFVPLWKMDADTEIKVKTSSSIKLNLVREADPQPLKKLSLRVDIINNVPGRDCNLTAVQLAKVFREYTPPKLVKRQLITGYTRQGARLEFKVKEMNFSPKFSLTEKKGFFGKVSARTVMDFVARADSPIRIIDRLFQSGEIETARFSLSAEKRFEADKWETLPIRMDVNELKEKIRQKLVKEKFIFKGHTIEIKDVSGYDIVVTFKKASLFDAIGAFDYDNQVNSPQHKLGYCIGEQVPIEFSPQHRDIVLTQGAPVLANQMSFKVIDVEENYLEDDFEHVVGNWISLADFKETLLGLDKQLVEKERITVELETGKFVVEVRKGRSAEEMDLDQVRYQTLWSLDEGSEITLPSNKDLNLSIVKDSVAQPLKSIKLIVDPVKEEVSFLEMMLGLVKKPESITLQDEDLKRIFDEHRPQRIVQDQKIEATTDMSQDLTISIKEMKFEGDVISTKDKRVLGKITDKTEVIFEEAKGASIAIQKEIKIVDLKDPLKYLKAMGLGGLDDQFKKLRRIFYMRSPKLRAQAVRRGLDPVRGVLFYGPPGTGKTSLARRLGEMLGCTGDRIKKITGTEVLSKWVGESEENIRKLFEPAKEAQEKFKEESPLFLIIVDEIDSILPQRVRLTKLLTSTDSSRIPSFSRTSV